MKRSKRISFLGLATVLVTIGLLSPGAAFGDNLRTESLAKVTWRLRPPPDSPEQNAHGYVTVEAFHVQYVDPYWGPVNYYENRTEVRCRNLTPGYPPEGIYYFYRFNFTTDSWELIADPLANDKWGWIAFTRYSDFDPSIEFQPWEVRNAAGEIVLTNY